MKKHSLLLALFFSCYFGWSQSPVYTAVLNAVHERYPEIQTEQRLIAVNFWSSSDQESREVNKALNKNYNIYKFARLKGGRHGLIAVAVNFSTDPGEAVITVRKDGAKDILTLTGPDLALDSAPFKNAVFDSEGKQVYTNLASGEVFNKINQLLTR